MAEEGLQVDAELLVVAVDSGPGLGLAALARAADASQDRGDDLVAEGEQSGDGAGGAWTQVVGAVSAGLVDQLLAADLSQVVGGLWERVGGRAGHGADLGGQLPDGEPAGSDGQGENRGQGVM